MVPRRKSPNYFPARADQRERQVYEHNASHLPYRNWCPICVESRGKVDAHPRGAKDNDEDKSGLPIISLDYNELEKDKVKTTVVKDE